MCAELISSFNGLRRVLACKAVSRRRFAEHRCFEHVMCLRNSSMGIPWHCDETLRRLQFNSSSDRIQHPCGLSQLVVQQGQLLRKQWRGEGDGAAHGVVQSKSQQLRLR